MLLATINSGTLIIALPDLERALGTSLLELVWVILAYMIASTVLVLTAGRLSDLFGRKHAYVGGFVVFALASLGAGFAGSGTELILKPAPSEASAKTTDRKSTRLNSSHMSISYAVFCLKKKNAIHH